MFRRIKSLWVYGIVIVLNFRMDTVGRWKAGRGGVSPICGLCGAVRCGAFRHPDVFRCKLVCWADGGSNGTQTAIANTLALVETFSEMFGDMHTRYIAAKLRSVAEISRKLASQPYSEMSKFSKGLAHN